MPNIYDYFQHACQREPVALREGVAGEKMVDEDGNSAMFSIEFRSGRIERVDYKCTTCFALVGFCEHVRELAVGLNRERALAIGADDLIRAHPEVPAQRHDRAKLATDAFHSAVVKANVVEGACA